MSTELDLPGSCGRISIVPGSIDSLWRCHYSVGTADNDEYRVIVGTNTRDRLGQTLVGDVISEDVTINALRFVADADIANQNYADQIYMVDQTVALTLPEGIGGAGTLSYTLTASIPDGIPNGLTFDAVARTLTGEPITATVVALTYTVTDENGFAKILTFMVRVTTTPGLTMADVFVDESAGEATVSVVLSHAVSGAFSVDASTEDGTGTAIAGEDYIAVSGHTLSFTGATAGETQTFTVSIIDDETRENAETLIVSLSTLQDAPAAGLDISDRATVTILANDIPPPLILGRVSGLNLNLILPVMANGKLYYHLDDSGNGRSTADTVQHILLYRLLNDGNPTKDTLPGGHDGRDDERSVIVGDYVLILPTHNELIELRSSQSDSPPAQWHDNYWTSTPGADGGPIFYELDTGDFFRINTNHNGAAAFQVLPFVFDPTFSETITDQTYTVSDTVALTLPTIGIGRPPLTYTLTPIPDGLTFDPAARTLTGTPTTPTVAALTYTVTDANGDMAEQSFTVTVFSSPTIANQVYIFGQSVALTLPEVSGGAGALSYTLTRLDGSPPLLPDGLTFDAIARTISAACRASCSPVPACATPPQMPTAPPSA